MPAADLEQLIAQVEAGPPACWEALRTLGQLGEPEAAAHLTALFAHRDPTVRFSAVIALGSNRANAAAAPLLAPLLADDDPFVRHHAGVAIHRLRVSPWTMTELDGLIRTALEAHRAWWNDVDEHEDMVALVTLHDLAKGTSADAVAGADHVVDVGLSLLRDDDPVVRIFASRLLREMHREAEIAAAFLEALQCERDEDALCWCVSGLGFRTTPHAVPSLASLVTHPNAQLRYSLGSALSACALPTMNDVARDALLALADNENDDVRYSALYELSSWWQQGSLRDPRVGQRLLQGQADADEGVRHTCEEAFEGDGCG